MALSESIRRFITKTVNRHNQEGLFRKPLRGFSGLGNLRYLR